MCDNMQYHIEFIRSISRSCDTPDSHSVIIFRSPLEEKRKKRKENIYVRLLDPIDKFQS